MTETVLLRPHAVRALLRAESYAEADNSVEVLWTTGATVQRYSWCDGPYEETLEVSVKAVRLGRLNGGVSFLDAHSSYSVGDIYGRTVPGSAAIAGGKGLCRVALSTDPAKAGIVGDIRGGIIADVSVGYIVHAMTWTDAQDGRMATCLVTDWEPFEISAVPIPADADAKVRSGAGQGTAARGENHPCVLTRAAPLVPAPAAPGSDPSVLARALAAAQARLRLSRSRAAGLHRRA